MTITKIRKGTFQHVESELYSYHETKKEILRLKNDILYGTWRTDDENVGGGRGNLPSDSTGRRATMLATFKLIEQMEFVIEAIETVYERLPDECRKLIEIRYWRRPQTLTWDGIALEVGVSRRQALYWRKAIVTAIAEQLGWM